jgi:hypothetical protein
MIINLYADFEEAKFFYSIYLQIINKNSLFFCHITKIKLKYNQKILFEQKITHLVKNK